MPRKKKDIKTASVYYELSFLFSFTAKVYQKMIGMASNIADKVDILKKEPNGQTKIGLTIHGIYFLEGMLDHEVNKTEVIVQELLHKSRRPGKITKKKVFFV